MKVVDYFVVTNTGGSVVGLRPTPWTSASPTSLVYTMQSVGVSMTSLPVDAKGAYNKTFQIAGTISGITTVIIEASVHPSIVNTPTMANGWFSVATLTATALAAVHSGGVRAMRARTTAVSSSDAFDCVFYFDDAG